MSTIQSTGSSGDAWAAMRAQRSQMQARMFAKVDTDGSGGVDKTELQTMLSKVSEKTGTDLTGNIDDTFNQFDTNGDGSLSSEELGKGMHDLLPPPSTMDFAQSRSGGPEQDQDDLFSKIDTNGDGSIDKDEMTVFTNKIKSDTGQDASDMFSKLDSDGDGKLTQVEFDAGHPEKPGPQGSGGPPPAGGPGKGGGAQSASGSDSKTYDPLDTNKDGVVSELERLVGELKTAAAAVSGDGHDDSQASLTIAELAKALYAQFAGSASQQSTNTVSALA